MFKGSIRFAFPFLFFSFHVCASAFSQQPIQVIETALLKQDYEEVRSLSKSLLLQSPDKTTADKANYYLGLSSLLLKHYIEAREVLEKLIDNDPGFPVRDKAYLAIYDSFYGEELYKEAVRVTQKMLKLRPKPECLSLIYLKSAKANLKLANWDDARDDLNTIIEDFPNSLEVYLAKQLLEEKQYFAVQVGSFRDRVRAEGLINELKNKEEYAYIVETSDQDGNKLYRVRIGQMTMLDEAQQLKVRLTDKGYPTQIFP